MGLEFERIWALALFPVCAALVLWIDRRYRRRVRSIKAQVTLWVRIALVLLLVLAVSAPSILLPGGVNVTWVLADVSDSTASVRMQMQERIQAELDRLPKGEAVGIIGFGGDAMVETPLSEQPRFSGFHTAVSPDASSLSQGLQLAGALLPSDSTGRILVLSDGQTDDVKNFAESLRGRGITVDVLETPVEALPDMQVTQVTVPSEVFEGNIFSIQVMVDSTYSSKATLVLYQNGAPGATREVDIRKGENLFVFQDVAEKTGVVTYEAKLYAEGDSQSKNNSASAYLYAAGAPTLLLVEGVPGNGAELSKMLLASGMKVERIAPEDLPGTGDALRAYDGIVLANVDYDSAEEEQWLALEAAVRVLGRGLSVFGGDHSYALGGYRGTTLEKILPVTVEVRNQLQLPALSLMLVLDKSGSMTAGQFGITRLEVAKEAAMRSTEVLMGKDNVGVIAFDDAAKWVVPLQEVTDVAAIQEMIGTIRPGGGTAFYAALEASIDALMQAETPQKHIIFLSDGEPGDRGFEQLVMRARQNGITLTTVAVGDGANTRLMEMLATIGGGRAYIVGEFDNIPKIFTKETFLVGGTFVQNREFIPLVTEISALTNFERFPRLTGYLSTLEKPMAVVSLVSDREDPVLAWWNYGAGTALAWTSDTEGAWTESFLHWEESAAFFGGLIGKTLPKETQSGDLQVQAENGMAHVSYVLPENAAAEGLQTIASVLNPDGTQTKFILTQTDVNTYEGSFSTGAQGAYALRIEQEKEGEIVRVKEGGAVVSFAKEYDLRGQSAEGSLSSLAESTGGRVLSSEEPFFPEQKKSVHARKQLATLLCGMAVVLWLFDIALRRLGWESAVLAWLGKQAEKGETIQSGAARKKIKIKKEPEKSSPADTADRLLAAKRKRKQL